MRENNCGNNFLIRPLCIIENTAKSYNIANNMIKTLVFYIIIAD